MKERSKKESDDKLTSLREQRRKGGLCIKCGGKWGPTHKCPAHIPLHVVEELIDALEPVDDPESNIPAKSEDEVIAVVS